MERGLPGPGCRGAGPSLAAGNAINASMRCFHEPAQFSKQDEHASGTSVWGADSAAAIMQGAAAGWLACAATDNAKHQQLPRAGPRICSTRVCAATVL